MKRARRKRVCVICGYKFFPPRISQTRISKRTTCSDDCAHQLNVERRNHWSKLDLQILHDIAESLPSRKLVQVYNNLATKNNRPTRTRNAIFLKCNDLKLSVKPLYNNLTTARIIKELGIDSNIMYRWIYHKGLKTARGSSKQYAHHYITNADLRKFARKHPEEFAGIDPAQLFLMLEDEDLVEYIKENHPVRIKHAGPMKVRCVETKQVFQSQAQAAKHFHLSRSALYRAINLGRRAAGHHFEPVK